MKKGQGLSITTIVIAVLSLIVLIVLTLIFTGKLGNFQESTSQQQASAEAQAQALAYVGNGCNEASVLTGQNVGTCRLNACGSTEDEVLKSNCGSKYTGTNSADVQKLLVCCKDKAPAIK